MTATPFQSSVLRKHLDALDGLACRQAYQRLRDHFGDREMQARISTLKEEEYQAGFLNDLFVRVLGYTLKPQPDYDLVAELRNVRNAKKADGAILRHGEEVHAVIELKGTDTIDLNRVEAQAFGYKVAHPDCRYVVTSNFQRLRFYVNDTTFFVEWNLFDCTYEDFRVLWLCLGREQLLSDLPHRVREESVVKEQEITKALYRDYTAFKRELFGHLQGAYPERDKLRLFQLSQKLLDRLLFVFFGEDKGLLPANTASKPIGDFDRLRELDAGQPLYALLNKYFGYIDRGHEREGWRIHAYNGGLFAPDAELESLTIPDPLLRRHLLKLTAYKFDSEVDVNILGHIFEHSLNEIEEVQASIRGEAVDRSKTKRKKDGVFYTPRYITKYIVESTVGRLCTERRAELGIDEQDYARGRKGRRKSTVGALRQSLEQYRQWLLDLKICDPACGSGAFLNEALDFLIREHNAVSELERQLFDAAIAFDPGPAILERNLYGVDINEEAIEIARLSLWLRTAEPGRTLTDLSGRIKVGNSLIDDPAVAGEKAFVWAVEFPEVFGEGARGGFDVVVGNPPYVKEATNRSAFLGTKELECYQGKMDLWYLFGALSLDIINSAGLIGIIATNNWITNAGGQRFRDKVAREGRIYAFIDFGDFKIFDDAGIQTMVYIMGRSEEYAEYIAEIQLFTGKNHTHSTVAQALQSGVGNNVDKWGSRISRREGDLLVLNNERIEGVARQIEMSGSWNLAKDCVTTGIDVHQDFFNATQAAAYPSLAKIGDGIFNLSTDEVDSMMLTPREKDYIKPFYTTNELGRYAADPQNELWIVYTDSSFKSSSSMDDLPNLKRHFDKFSPVITSSNGPYGLHRARSIEYFNGETIVVARKDLQPSFSYTDFDCYVSQTFNIIRCAPVSLKALTVVLNSAIVKFWLRYMGKMQGSSFQIDVAPLLSIPLPEFGDKVPKLEAYHDLISGYSLEAFNASQAFLRLVGRRFSIARIPSRLEDWPSHDFATFIQELNKALKKAKHHPLSLAQELEWEPIFIAERAKILNLRAEITQLDREIDLAVYRLYGLTWEEVLMVDPSAGQWINGAL